MNTDHSGGDKGHRRRKNRLVQAPWSREGWYTDEYYASRDRELDAKVEAAGKVNPYGYYEDRPGLAVRNGAASQVSVFHPRASPRTDGCTETATSLKNLAQASLRFAETSVEIQRSHTTIEPCPADKGYH